MVRFIDASTHIISTIAGLGSPGYTGDGDLAVTAQLSNPTSLAIDGDGNIYIFDQGNGVIRRIDILSSIITTYFDASLLTSSSSESIEVSQASHLRSASPENRRLAVASLPKNRYHMTFDPSSNLYVSDAVGCVIVQVYQNNSFSILVGTFGSCGYRGDGLSVYDANANIELNNPLGLAFHSARNALLIVDNGNNRVRQLDMDTGNISTIIGSGEDGYSGDGGMAIDARISNPTTVTVNVKNDIYVVDANYSVIRSLNASSGVIFTYAGIGSAGFNGDNLRLGVAQLNHPYSVIASLDDPNTFYITDAGNNRIRAITLADTSPTFAPTDIFIISSGSPATLVSGSYIAIWTVVSIFVFALLTMLCCYCCLFAAAAAVIDKDPPKIDWYRLEIDPIDFNVSDDSDDELLSENDDSKQDILLGLSDSELIISTSDINTSVEYPSVYGRDAGSPWESSMVDVVDKYRGNTSRIISQMDEGSIDDQSQSEGQYFDEEEEDGSFRVYVKGEI